MGAYLKDKGTVNSLVTEITIKQTLLQFLFLCRSSIPLKLGHLVLVSTVSILNRIERKVVHLGPSWNNHIDKQSLQKQSSSKKKTKNKSSLT